MLRLGPIVGHTTSTSARVWIRTGRPATEYRVRVPGVGLFGFVPTPGPSAALYGTAVAEVVGLRPDWRYRYEVIHRGRVLGTGRGRFRTMPPPRSWSPQVVLVASCSHNTELGAWYDLARFVRDLEPHAIFFVGDQVYQDDPRPGTAEGLWKDHLNGRLRGEATLRRALADTYQQAWSRPPIAEVLRSCATYMMWDDHDIRDGWGSWASDSVTVAGRSDTGARVCAVDEAYFQAARDAAWHFQLCRNPQSYPRAGPDGTNATATATQQLLPGVFAQRTPFGFALEVSRVSYVVVDSRGDRDLWREGSKVLGAAQWAALDRYVDGLLPDIDAAAFITPVPIVAAGPNGFAQSLFEGAQDDVDLVEAGKDQELRRYQLNGSSAGTTAAGLGRWGVLTYGAPFAPVATRNVAARTTNFRHSDLDDARDQWSNEHSRLEQERLIRLGLRARVTGRPGGVPRAVMFAGGDLHVGAQLMIEADGHLIPSLIASGLSKEVSAAAVTVTLDQAFDVARGIRATPRNSVNVPNFGMMAVNVAPRPAEFTPTNVHQSGREASALRVGGYVITGDPIPEYVRRHLHQPPASGFLPDLG